MNKEATKQLSLIQVLTQWAKDFKKLKEPLKEASQLWEVKGDHTILPRVDMQRESHPLYLAQLLLPVLKSQYRNLADKLKIDSSDE